MKDLEKEISEMQDKRIMERTSRMSKNEQKTYYEGYADALIYMTENYESKFKK